MLFILMAFTNSESIKNMTITIIPQSKLLVRGKTNVNKFNCDFNVLKLKNPIPVIFEKKDDKIVFNKTKLILDSSCFDCGSKGINSDFKDLLKSDAYPHIILELKEIKNDFEDEDRILAYLDLEIAGIRKSYSVPIIMEGETTMSIKGKLDLNIRDFNITPPKKALGLIVVDEIIQIDFQLMVQEY